MPHFDKTIGPFRSLLDVPFDEAKAILNKVKEHNSPWLSTWFDNGSFMKIPIEEFDIETISVYIW